MMNTSRVEARATALESGLELTRVPDSDQLDSGIVPYHQKLAVVSRIPFLEIIQRLLSHLKPGTSLERLLALMALVHAGVPVFYYLKETFVYWLSSQITVAENEEIAKDLIAYLSAEVITAGNTTDAILMSTTDRLPTHKESGPRGFLSAAQFFRVGMDFGKETQVGVTGPGGVGTLPKSKLFWVGYRPFVFSLIEKEKTQFSVHASAAPSQSHTYMLRTPGLSVVPIYDFLERCHEFRRQQCGETTTIYFSAENYGHPWQSVTKAVRKLDTIDIDEHIKSDLIQDAENYFAPETKQIYADCGIPYRRGYLFHGPPGTGKTSFSAALAGHLKCPLYLITLGSSAGDHRLLNSMLSLPQKCVVVIEDIDSAGIGRERAGRDVSPPAKPGITMGQYDRLMQREIAQIGGKITLSGLLNAIDGNVSPEGRLLIMTSNKPDSLDDALIRPGRIDKQIYFGNLSKEASCHIFMRLMGRFAIAAGKLSPEEAAAKATRFSEKLPVNVFTPAQVQNFLLGCRGDMEKAINEVAAWVEENRPDTSSSDPTVRGRLTKRDTSSPDSTISLG